ncbi:ribosomal maturation YjgA family protein [Ferruginibacter profundus]
MNSTLRFSYRYFLLAVALFITEIMIALYVHDTIVRPYIGDLLVVILIYCAVKAFINTPVLKTAIAVLLFAFAIETLQYLKIVEVLGLQQSKLARVIIGTSFEWGDIAAYIAGILVVLVAEKLSGNLK